MFLAEFGRISLVRGYLLRISLESVRLYPRSTFGDDFGGRENEDRHVRLRKASVDALENRTLVGGHVTGHDALEYLRGDIVAVAKNDRAAVHSRHDNLVGMFLAPSVEDECRRKGPADHVRILEHRAKPFAHGRAARLTCNNHIIGQGV